MSADPERKFVPSEDWLKAMTEMGSFAQGLVPSLPKFDIAAFPRFELSDTWSKALESIGSFAQAMPKFDIQRFDFSPPIQSLATSLALSDAMKEFMAVSADIAAQEKYVTAVEQAGWLPHALLPRDAVVTELEAPNPDVGGLLERYVAENWPALEAAFADRAARCGLDADAIAAHKDALAAHGHGLYRPACRTIFPELERIVREGLAAKGRPGTIQKLRQRMLDLTLPEMGSYGLLGFRMFEFMDTRCYGFVEGQAGIEKLNGPTSLAEFVALAKSKPGKLNYGSAGIGSTHHLAMELLKSKAGINLIHVPYKGSAQALPDLIAGQIDAMYLGIAQTLPFFRSGQLVPLAVGSAQRLKALPKVPTLAETYPGLEADAWWAFFAPAGTPEAIIRRLAADIDAAVKVPATSERLLEEGLLPVGTTPQELAQRVRVDREKWQRVISDAHIKLD